MTATTLAEHTLGPDGPTVSALGIGTWALGGPSPSTAATPAGARSTTRRASAPCTPPPTAA
jgi:aryl-alcohol dehydrogenase-like predicted oxidoreductase